MNSYNQLPQGHKKHMSAIRKAGNKQSDPKQWKTPDD